MNHSRRKVFRPYIRSRSLWAVGADVVAVFVAYYLMLLFRYQGMLPDWTPWTAQFAAFIAMAVVIHVGINWATGVYSIVNRYMSLIQAIRVAWSSIVCVAVLFVINVIWPLATGGSEYLVPRSVVLGGGALSLFAMVGVRFSRRVAYEAFGRKREASDRLLLVGAGQAADMLVREIRRTPGLNMSVVGMLDDDHSLSNTSIQGHPVLGRIADAPGVVSEHGVTQIVVAVPSASAEEIARIYRICKPTGVPVKILPSLADMVSGTVSLRDARDLDLQDLLGRPQVETDLGRIFDLVNGQSVLVTGAGGSIGSELCRQLATFEPERLVLVDHDESSLYALHETLQSQGFQRYILRPASILQERKLDALFALHRPQLVFHAAAYKHVPLMELSPDEAVLNNIRGTMLVAQTAGHYGAKRMVNISTDKAVDPVNVMGATKRAGELIIHMLAERYPETKFASVRFGNVLGSQGSVIPIFKSQIESGGPITITHPDMTRYFMLIEEAVQLVIQAAVMLDEEPEHVDTCLSTFILEMGDPVSIIELAQRMIDFYWKDHGKALGVEFSGLRPGEKIDERLTYDYEETASTSHPLVKRVHSRNGCPLPVDPGSSLFEERILHLVRLAGERGTKQEVIEALASCVPGYNPLQRESINSRT